MFHVARIYYKLTNSHGCLNQLTCLIKTKYPMTSYVFRYKIEAFDLARLGSRRTFKFKFR